MKKSKRMQLAFACKCISLAIKLMPKDWRNEETICNLIKAKGIEV